MNSQASNEYNALCSAIKKFRQKHAPQAAITLIVKLEQGSAPIVHKSNPETEPIVVSKPPRPSQMPITAYCKRKRPEEDQIESKKEKPTDESDGYVYNPDDFKNPFGSQESTLSDNLFIGEAFAKIESATDAELPGKKEGSDDKVEVDAEEELEPDEIEEIIDDENEEEETKNLTFSERQDMSLRNFGCENPFDEINFSQ